MWDLIVSVPDRRLSFYYLSSQSPTYLPIYLPTYLHTYIHTNTYILLLGLFLSYPPYLFYHNEVRFGMSWSPGSVPVRFGTHRSSFRYFCGSVWVRFVRSGPFRSVPVRFGKLWYRLKSNDRTEGEQSREGIKSGANTQKPAPKFVSRIWVLSCIKLTFMSNVDYRLFLEIHITICFHFYIFLNFNRNTWISILSDPQDQFSPFSECRAFFSFFVQINVSNAKFLINCHLVKRRLRKYMYNHYWFDTYF